MDYQVLSIDEFVRECAERPCPEAWAEFIRRFHRLIAATVIRACREWGETRQEIIEELIQDMYVKLCANDRAVLRRYQPRYTNGFLGYLKAMTAHMVYDYFRPDPDKKAKTVPLIEEINAAQSGNIEDEIFFQKVDKILRERGNRPQDEKERAIFWLYYRHGMTAKEIASIPGIKLTVKGVESCIFRLLAYIRKRLFGDRPGETPGGIPPV